MVRMNFLSLNRVFCCWILILRCGMLGLFSLEWLQNNESKYCSPEYTSPRLLTNGEFKLSQSPFKLKRFLLDFRLKKWHYMLRFNRRLLSFLFRNFAIDIFQKYYDRIWGRLCIGNKWVMSLLHVLQFCWIVNMLSQQLGNSNQEVGIWEFCGNAAKN